MIKCSKLQSDPVLLIRPCDNYATINLTWVGQGTSSVESNYCLGCFDDTFAIVYTSLMITNYKFLCPISDVLKDHMETVILTSGIYIPVPEMQHSTDKTYKLKSSERKLKILSYLHNDVIIEFLDDKSQVNITLDDFNNDVVEVKG